ncbi:MAG: molybdate ABC transporter substrate-binding protein [Nitrososphaerota archaeon]|jgi:molybdate transport system substrate-binding protein|nr:molybdate ABC transporter substrate-binding protein [Nitrososphaerota archaeon]
MHKTFAATALALILLSASIAGYLIYTNYASSPSTELRIFMAASLTSIVANMTQEFEQTHNCNLLINSASSGTLYTQITQGSPCDIFMSADNKWTNQLKANDLLYQDTAIDFTNNSLSIILAPGNPAGITSLADLAKPGVKLVIAEPSVPAGNYANQTIWKIDSTWGNASNPQYVISGTYINYNASIYQNVRSYESNVENVVGQVALSGTTGLYDAGIVYASDGVYGALSGQPTEFLKIPSEVNQKAIYSIAIIGSTNQPELAQKFLDFWISQQGQSLLAYYGFGI